MSQQHQHDNLDSRITIRLTKEEKARCQIAADAAGLTLSDFIRRRLLGLKITDRYDVQVIYQLNYLQRQLFKAMGLFKHLYNLNPVYAEETGKGLQTILRGIADIQQKLAKIEITGACKSDRQNSTEER